MKTQNNKSPLKVMLLLIVCIAFSSFTQAQNLTGLTTVITGDTETYVFNSGLFYKYPEWKVTNGTLISTSQDGTKHIAVIQWGNVGTGNVVFEEKFTSLGILNVTINQPSSTAVTDINYIHNITPRVATTNINSLSSANKIETITYFDGLGRPKQSVGIRAGGNSEDIITHIEYDEFGRNTKEYLPYTSSANIGTYRTDALSATNTYYDANSYNDDFPGMTVADINPYSEKEFDNSPLNRVMKQAAPGKDWKLGNGHEIEMDYQSNTTDEVRLYSVSLNKETTNNVITYTPTLVNNNFYAANELYKTITKDENHDGSASKLHTTEEFKNKQGQVVLKRTYALVNTIEEPHDTYYVYDDYGNLSFVLSPKAEAHTEMPNPIKISELCYQYKYDNRNRLVEKKIPGKGWEYIVYNKLDQPIMTQDTEMKENNKWLVTKYDAFARVVYTAIKIVPSTRVDLQGAFDNDPSSVPQYESKAAGSGYLNTYYTSLSQPTVVNEILTINYYDNYNFDVGAGLPEASYGVTPITNPKGLATGSKVKVLNTNDWITTVTYYNEKSQPIFVYSRNDYLDTSDKIKSKLTFDGRTTETTSTHKKSFYSTISIVDKYTYDHTNRLLRHTQKINNAALEEVIASNSYDDLGQLSHKLVGGKTNVLGGLQTVDYDYNIRGWLKAINNVSNLGNDLFGFKINYNDAQQGTPLFNGNISQTVWKTKNTDQNTKAYSYTYDALNRIINAIDNTGKFNLHSVDYDKNGNITSLIRKGHIVPNPVLTNNTHYGTMDNLIYTYEPNSNRLKKVDDTANFTYGFKNGAAMATEYTYDDNGNMLTDQNKGITSNISYNHLNLPTNVNLNNGNIQYIYDATGVKQKKIVSVHFGSTTNTEYAGNFIYENGALKMFSHPEGYTEQISHGKVPTFGYAYQYKDHLGNIRLTYADSDNNGSINSSTEIIEENNYYPFGLKHKGYNNVVSANANSAASRFKFGGKELSDELGLNTYDFGARNYQPDLARWSNIDALADAKGQIHNSPYVYAMNNPIVFDDPDGNCPPGVDCAGIVSAISNFIFNDTGNGKKTLTLGLHNLSLPIADRVSMPLSPGHEFLANSTIAAYNSVANTWNGGMNGQTLGDMTSDGIAELGNTVRRIENGEGTIQDAENLTGTGMLTAATVISVKMGTGRSSTPDSNTTTGKGAANPKVKAAIEAGKRAHKDIQSRAAEKGWGVEVPMKDPQTGKTVYADLVTRSGAPIEIKPNTASGIAKGRRQLPQYERATGMKGRIITYDPKKYMLD